MRTNRERRGGEFQAVGDLVSDLLRKTGAVESLKQQKVCEAWNQTLGPELARHAKVVRLRGTTLLVEVDSAARMMELKTFFAKEHLKKVNEHLGSPLVTKLQYRFATDAMKEKL